MFGDLPNGLFPCLVPTVMDKLIFERTPETLHGSIIVAIAFPAHGCSHVGLLCGIDLWRRHDDPEIAHVRYGVFDALRDSALRAGWRLDAGGVWNCPRCKMNPAYRTPQPLAHWHPDAYSGRGSHITGHDGYQDAQFWLQVQAENVVLERTRDGVRNGRHRAGPR